MSRQRTPRERPVPSAFIAASLAEKPCGEVGPRGSTSPAVGCLRVGEDPRDEAVPVPPEQFVDTRYLFDIDSDANNAARARTDRRHRLCPGDWR